MTERALQLQVHDLLRARPGLIWHHCGSSHLCAGQAGMPDLLVIGPRRILWQELKGDATPVRHSQRDFGQALVAAGQSWGVWRPDDLVSGTIEAQLDELLEPRSWNPICYPCGQAGERMRVPTRKRP